MNTSLPNELHQAIDCLCAADGKSPIRRGEPHAFEAGCAPMSPEWRQRLADPKTGKSWSTEHPEYGKTCNLQRGGREVMGQSRIWDLSRDLLSFGGEQTCLPELEPDLDRILDRGQLWGGRAKKVRGQRSRCHSNSATLWQKRPDELFIATGYALSDDGLWRQHTWCVEPAPTSPKSSKPPRPRVIETTESRLLYFGYVMDPREARVFAKNNGSLDLDAVCPDSSALDSLMALLASQAAKSAASVSTLTPRRMLRR